MKQTNNAIKFLMAQYRAIFKNANIAMVAAMAAAALAAGQAQALDLTGTTAQNPSGAATITGSDTITGASGGYINGLVISGSANSLTATNLTKHIFVGGNVTVSNGASLTLSGATGSVAGLTGSFDESFDDKNTVLDVNGANLSVTQSQVQMNRINFTDATVTLGTNNEDVANSDWKDNALINAEVAWKDGKVVEGTGVITVDGATGDNAKTIKLNSGSALVAATFNLNGGKIAMDGTLDAGSGSIIRAYREGDQSVVNFKGTDLSTKGSGNYIAGRTINVTAGTIDVAKDSELHLSGTLDGSATEPSIAAAQQAGTVNVTGGKLNVVGNLVVEGKTGNAGTKLNISETAELTGTGSISLGQQARLVINKSSLDKFVKVDGKGGKVNFNGTTSQVKLESSDVADLSKYTYGSGDGADFDVTSQNTIGKIIGDKLAITKGVTGTFTEATGKIKVEAETLSLGAADSESKLSAIQGTTFTQLTAHDKLTLAGKGDKFTIDQGDMFLTNTSATEVSVIDGANINFETGRIQIKGSWTTDSDITFTGGAGTSNANIYFGNASGLTNSLTLSGTIKNDKAANTWGGINVGATKKETTLDVTKATLASTGNAGSLVTLGASEKGVIKITGAQASDILAAKDNTKGFALGVQSGGTVTVQGELKADFADFVAFDSSSSVTANKFVIGATDTAKAGGTLVADKINISASGDTLSLNKASIKSADITLGNGTLKSGSVVATSKLNIGEFTLGDSGAFALEGKGTVSGTTLTVNGTNASLDVDGSWTLNSGLTTTTSKGTVTIDNESMLSVTGALDVADNTVKVNNGSTFKADYSKANATDKKLGKVDVDATSHLELTNYDKASISLDDLKAQKEKFLGQNVSGLFGITGKNGATVTVTGTKAENGKVSYTDAQGAANLDGIYAGVTVTGVKGDVTSTNDWGAVQLDSGTTSLHIGSSSTAGAVHLNGAGSNVLVADKDNNAANVALNHQDSVLIINKSGQIKDITAGAANNGNVVVMDNAQLTAGDIGAGTAVGSVDVLGNLVAKNVNAQSITVDGTVSNAKSLTAKEFEIFGNVNADAVTLNASGTMTVEAAAVDTGTLAIGESGSMTVTAGAVVTADTLNGATNAVINVGQDGVENGTASLFAGTLNLKSGTLFVDPEYGEHYAAVTVTNFSSQGSTQTDDKSAGSVDGKINVGKNAALGVGFESKAELDAILANYVNADGSFYKSSSNGLANALVLNKAITLSDQDGIYVAADATASSAQANKVTIKNGAGLIITDNVFTPDSVTGKKTGIAITVDNGATIDVTDAQLKLIGNFTGADKGLQIFSDTTNPISGTMTIKSANGLLKGELYATTGKMDLSFDRDAAVNAGAFADASEPVRNMLLDQLDGKLAYSKAIGYQLIADAATASLSGAVVDAAAHAATYAGAQQAAVLSVTTMADAMFGRVGAVGVEAASISATGSQANGGVWLTPMYKSMDSDGFNAQGASYGSDVDAAGVAFGADTVNGNMRFGAVFNIGSGDADGKGNGSGLKDEFDYYGLGIYSAMGFGNFALVGDASLTVISHDVEGHGFKGKADTTAVTMGVTGQYTVATPSVDVTPHLGARFIRLNTDSYDLISAKGVEATTDFDVQNVFSVPLGVTLSKGFVAGGWTLAPSADLSVTFNTGDTDAKSTTTFTGVKALSLNTEVLDEVQYGVTLGLGAQNGAFGTSLNVNYTGSSNTDSFGVNAQCRYMF